MFDNLSLQDIFILGSFVCISIYLWTKYTSNNHPPGPRRLPIIGNLLDIDTKNIPKSLGKCRQKYGDIYMIQLGTLPMVVISGFKNIRELFLSRGDEFSSRPDNLLTVDIYQRSGQVNSTFLKT